MCAVEPNSYLQESTVDLSDPKDLASLLEAFLLASGKPLSWSVSASSSRSMNDPRRLS